MKVAVIGPGALGCLYAGLLAADGNDVWLLHHREADAATIAARGVEIESRDGDTRRIAVEATVDATEVGPVDLAIVLVKAHHTVAAVRQHESCVGPETRVLSLQNGLGNHYRLREHVGEDRTLHGVSYQGVVWVGPGRIRRTGPGRTILGGPDAEFAARVGAAFESADVETRVVLDPFQYVWRKQLVGVAIKPLAALTHLSNRALVTDEGTADLMYRLMEEAAAVASTRGVELDVETTYENLVDSQATSDHTSSMLQDVEAGRETEIEDVNGAIVELAEEAGVDVPYNEMATLLVRGLQDGYLDRIGEPDDLDPV